MAVMPVSMLFFMMVVIIIVVAGAMRNGRKILAINEEYQRLYGAGPAFVVPSRSVVD